jgi:putative acetyltransferase
MSSDLEIRAETASDWTGVHALHCAAFGSAVEADLVAALREAGVAEISLVAVRAGALAGHVLFSRLEAPMRALALAPVAVQPEQQRRGAGSALISAGLDRARAGLWEAVFVVGDPAYYRRFGFSVEDARGFDAAYAGDYFMVKRLGRDPLPASGRIVYPRPFAAL